MSPAPVSKLFRTKQSHSKHIGIVFQSVCAHIARTTLF
jgi:hypothetical protein